MPLSRLAAEFLLLANSIRWWRLDAVVPGFCVRGRRPGGITSPRGLAAENCTTSDGAALCAELIENFPEFRSHPGVVHVATWLASMNQDRTSCFNGWSGRHERRPRHSERCWNRAYEGLRRFGRNVAQGTAFSMWSRTMASMPSYLRMP